MWVWVKIKPTRIGPQVLAHEPHFVGRDFVVTRFLTHSHLSMLRILFKCQWVKHRVTPQTFFDPQPRLLRLIFSETVRCQFFRELRSAPTEQLGRQLGVDVWQGSTFSLPQGRLEPGVAFREISHPWVELFLGVVKR